MQSNGFFRRRLAQAALLALAVTALAAGCGDDNEAQPQGTGELPLPAELQFKKLDQEFQQQQQQFGPLCPKKFRTEVLDTGQVTIFNEFDQKVLEGQLQRNSFAQLATTANEVASSGFTSQVNCQTQPMSQLEGNAVLTSQQILLTNKQNQQSIAVAQKDATFCDFSKSGKGKQLQQQFQQVAKDSCSGNLPPLPTASPSPSPTPGGSPGPSPSPGGSPTPSPSASPSPTPSATPEPTNTACQAAASQVLADFRAAQQCTTDVECVYVNGLDIVPRDATNVFVTEFECGDTTPSLVVANQTYLEQNEAKLRIDLLAAIAECELTDGLTTCDGVGGFLANQPPVCQNGVCIKGTGTISATPAASPSPTALPSPTSAPSPTPTATPTPTPTPSPSPGTP